MMWQTIFRLRSDTAERAYYLDQEIEFRSSF
jgi:hypothetical protein